MSPSLEQRVKEWAEGLIETLEVWPPMKRQELIEHRARTLIAAVRAETIEECAKVCDAQAYVLECADDTMAGVFAGKPYRNLAAQCRALVAERKGEK